MVEGQRPRTHHVGLLKRPARPPPTYSRGSPTRACPKRSGARTPSAAKVAATETRRYGYRCGSNLAPKTPYSPWPPKPARYPQAAARLTAEPGATPRHRQYPATWPTGDSNAHSGSSSTQARASPAGRKNCRCTGRSCQCERLVSGVSAHHRTQQTLIFTQPDARQSRADAGALGILPDARDAVVAFSSCVPFRLPHRRRVDPPIRCH